MEKKYRISAAPKAVQENVITGDTYRITVLTDRLIRLEYEKNGYFTDVPTQIVWNRDFPAVSFQVTENEQMLEVQTEYLQLQYDKGPFSAQGLTIRLKQGAYSNHSIWHFMEKGDNLKGTARTLDECNGATELSDGVLGRNGYAVLDDSSSMEIREDGFVSSPPASHQDYYFFGYGHAYLECIQDFYRLTGRTPLLPRFAFGNWWSRYHAYTQEEYLGLMHRFEEEGIPFSVGVIDMDWHYVQIPEKYGNGWTGYTWNEELFPDHVGMLRQLHEMGLHISLNVHPADGVRGHEKAYPDMARALSINPESETPIAFDVTNEKFLEAYFTYLHHPLEKEGVDFWWLDWQQGTNTAIAGLDPLWMLNHYHFLDIASGKKRPFLFSRYAGPGSHRYPVGFSGDTIITWESLDYQPYFTATASNIGYSWWSHDIGGHMQGCRDDELAVRWVQFGVFSPIMRLHSSNSEFSGKEPWKFRPDICEVMKKFLRLRHTMIPYLYTMNRRTSEDGIPLICPLYYYEPDNWKVYSVKNEYYFGSQLLVHPITAKTDPVTQMGRVSTWIPEGMWYDIFTGLRYRGGRMLAMYRDVSSIPVLAKAGSIIPTEWIEDVENKTENPSRLELWVFAGKEGSFTMYEDAGDGMAYKRGEMVTTEYTLKWGEEKNLMIHPAKGQLSLIPQKRQYRIRLYGADESAVEEVLVEGQPIPVDTEQNKKKNCLLITLPAIEPDKTATVRMRPDCRLCENQVKETLWEILNRAQTDYVKKDMLYETLCRSENAGDVICAAGVMNLGKELTEAIQEVILAE